MMKRMLMAAVAVCGAVGAFAATTKDYVQENLIACWDGYENAGEGRHDETLAYPVELISGIETTLTGTMPAHENYFALGQGYLTFASADIIQAINEGRAAVEIVLAKNGATVKNGGIVSFGKPNRGFWVFQNASLLVNGYSYHAAGGSETAGSNYNDDGVSTLSYVLGPDGDTSWFSVNGETRANITRWARDTSGNCYIGYNPDNKVMANAKVYAVRVYSTALTPEQIATNREVDVTRFVEGDVGTEFECTWTVDRYSTYAGDCQQATVIAKGDKKGARFYWDLDGDGTFEAEGKDQQIVFTTPGAHTVTLKAVNPAGVEKTCSHDFSIRAPVTLNVPSANFATVEAALAAAQSGDVVALAPGVYTNATADGIAVPRDVTLKGMGADPSETTVATPAGTGSASLVTVTGGRLENITFTGARCNSDTSVPRVLSASEGALVTNCVFTGHKTTAKGNLVLITGEGTRVVDTTISEASFTGGNNWTGGYAVRILDKAVVSDTVIDNVDMRVGTTSAGVVLSGGAQLLRSTVRNCDVYTMENFLGRAGGVCIDSSGAGCLVDGCVIEENSITTDQSASKKYQGAGGLAVNAAATVRNTVIRNNTSGNAYCGGVWLAAAATLENCLIAGNKVTAPINAAQSVAGIYANNASSVLRHVTVVGNELAAVGTSVKAHGAYLNGAQAVNSIFWGNGPVATAATSMNLAVAGAKGCVTHSLVSSEAEWLNASNAQSGEGCVTGDPRFTDAANGDYTLTGLSAALDIGSAEDALEDDLRGVARPKNAGYDLGAYECEYTATYECSLQPAMRYLGPAGGTVTFTGNATMPTLVSRMVWSVEAQTLGAALPGGEGASCDIAFPEGDETYTVTLTTFWSDGHEAVSAPATVRVVNSIPLAPGDDLVACLASLAGLDASNPVTVDLAAGTYTAENSGVADDAEWMFTVPSGVVLRGAGAGETVLDGGLSRRVLKLLSGAKACDLTVANAYSLGKTDIDRGYAVDVAGGVLADSVVTNALTAKAGEQVVYVNGGTVSGTRICGSQVSGNKATSHGGVLYVTAGTVTNCQICANAVSDKNVASLTLNGSTALAVDCDVFGNSAGGVEYRSYGTAGISLYGKATVMRCRVYNNVNTSGAGYYYAGGINAYSDGKSGTGALIDSCIVSNNVTGCGTSHNNGASGGVLLGGNAILRNSLVVSNRIDNLSGTGYPPVAGGVLLLSATASIENCTICGNAVNGTLCESSGIRCTAAGSVVNSIIWRNGGTPKGGEWMESNVSNTTATVTTCWMEDPSFEAGSYRLSASSPCIDAGTNQDWMDGATDLAGDPRIRNGFVDIGAFESEHIPVYECSILPLTNLLGPAGGTTRLRAVVTMPAFVESAVWTVTAATGEAPAGGEGTEFDLVCPPGVNTYTVSLKVTWSGGQEATAPDAAVVRVVNGFDIAPGDDLASLLANLTELSADNPVTVNLAAGTYTAENSGVRDEDKWMFTVPSGVILRGAGAGETVLDGELSRRVLRLLSGAKACGLTVANARSLGMTDITRGYGIDIAGGVLADCVVTNALSAAAGEHIVYMNGGTVSGTRICGAQITGNFAGSHGGVLFVTAGTVTNCQVCANLFTDKNGSALTLNGPTALAVDCDVFGNTARGAEYRTAGSGGASILSGGGTLLRCRMTDNVNTAGAGYSYVGGLCVAGGDALIDRCVISGNSSGFGDAHTDYVAGGVLLNGKCTLRNTLVVSNRLSGVALTTTKPVGGGVLVTSKDAKVENCTIGDNTLDGGRCEGAGIRLTTAASVANSIIWRNGGTPTGGEWMLGNISNLTASITYTCTMPLVDGEGNIAADPKLKVKKGYLVKSSSPCVNAGDPTGWTDDDVDLAGNPRLRKNKIDMGCYQAILQGLMLMLK